MAETMTYDAGTDTVTTSGNLSEEEQDSLIVGEKMQEEQEQLLAGKYKNAEDLEKAYVELQKKLGGEGDEDSEDVGDSEYDDEEEGEEEESEETEDYSEAVDLINEASAEFYDNDGVITQETFDKFSNMDSQDLVNAYLDLQQGQESQQQQTVEMSDGEVNAIQNSVGGEEAYQNIIEWAGENLNDSYINAFDNLVESGNSAAIQLALSGIKSQYDNSNGYEGRMLTGKSPKTSGDVFRSYEELVAAQNDPRYDKDPAYQRDIIEKLDRSNLNF
tara:strand:+ start:62 stop:883 length:822 start_codon:yes stop_codon:yes gene_type:complete